MSNAKDGGDRAMQMRDDDQRDEQAEDGDGDKDREDEECLEPFQALILSHSSASSLHYSVYPSLTDSCRYANAVNAANVTLNPNGQPPPFPTDSSINEINSSSIAQTQPENKTSSSPGVDRVGE
ncbi:hypothetical protein FRC20_008430 [Serendipita sp. 405]|nr:hypothetical protein FRC20_008430 [Serendipita sp. 405]